MRSSILRSSLSLFHTESNTILSGLRSFFACLLVLIVVSQLQAQVTSDQSSVSFGSVAVGAPIGNIHSLSFTIPPSLTLGGISAFTQGAPNLDFTVVTGGNCTSGSTGTTCTVNVQFLPTAVGTRLAAVVLTDQSGNTLISVPVNGVGIGPQVGFAPGTITTVAGNGTQGYNGDNIPATSAELSWPRGAAFDGAGNLYIVDSFTNRVRKVTPGGIITTVAGTGTAGYNGDNIVATSAQLNYPSRVAVDGVGNLYIAEGYSSRIRKVSPDGIITTVAGNGTMGYNGDNIPAINAQLNYPHDVAVDGVGNLYIADNGNSRIRKVTPDGTITTVVGTGGLGYNGDNIPGINAELNQPFGVAVDGSGNLYIADSYNHRIRKVTPDGTITTIAGNGICQSPYASCYSGDGGPATSAQLSAPYAVAVDGADNLYIVDTYNQRIRKVTPDGTITTVAGIGGNGYNGDNIAAPSAQLNFPLDVAVDNAGNLYIADNGNGRIRKADVSDPPALTFAGTDVGAASPEQDVAVLNLGNTPLTISQIGITPNFSLGGAGTTCISTGQTLNAAAGCVLGIEFTPATIGNVSGSVVLTDNTLNAIAAVQTIALQGTGTQRQEQTITFSNPGTLTYGVGSITLTASASSGLPVSYAVLSGPATVSGNTLTITGAGSITVQATQSGNSSYAAATPVSVTFIVNKATPAISFTGAPASAAYNSIFAVSATTNASSAALITASGACTVSGSVVTMISGTGTCSLSANWAADNNYLTATATQSTAAVKIAPAVTFTGAPASAPYQATFTVLAHTNASTTASITASGSCTNIGATVTITAPSGTCSVHAAWAADSNYLAASADQSTVATKAAPVIAWATPVPISYGTALSASQLNATASYNGAAVVGTFAYTPGTGTVLGAGTKALSVVFTPTNTANYVPAAATVMLQVYPATPMITWAKPAAITYGTALSSKQLDATATVPGSFAYSPSAGTILTAGIQTLSATFTPTDTTDYVTGIVATTSITVNKTNSKTTVMSTAPNPSLVGQAVVVSFSVVGTGVPTGTVTVAASTGEKCTGTLSAGAGHCSLTFATAGSRTLVASYAGDNNFNSSSSGKFKQQVQP